MRKRWVRFALKVAVSAVLMGYLFRKSDWGELGRALGGANIPVLALALLLHVPGYYVSAFRWRVLMRAQGGDDSIHRLVASYLVGTFLNNFLPTGIGGDVSRVYDTAGSAGGATRSVAVILVERATGLIAVVGLGCLATILPWPSGSNALDAYFWALLVVLLAGFAVVLSRSLSAFGVHWLRRLHLGGVGKGLAEVAERIGHFRNEGRTLAATFAYSFVLQANVILHCALVAAAMGIRVPWLFFAKAVPAVTFVMFLPVTMGGLGVRENAWVWLLAQSGLDREAAVAYSLAMLAMVVAPAVVGGIVCAARRGSGGKPETGG